MMRSKGCNKFLSSLRLSHKVCNAIYNCPLAK